MMHDRLTHDRWRLEADGGAPSGSSTEAVDRVVRAPGRRVPLSAVSGSWSRSWEHRQLRRVPVLALLCCWMVAAVSHAAVAGLFMWLLFACMVTVSFLSLLERGIHSLDMWSEWQSRRR
jgi:Flp pilus assembly protein TadB